MPIFQVTPNELKALSETSFGAEGMMERKDIQRLLREQINVLDERLMVIAEEFGDWLDSSRRIDLLCIDRDANLVVVELKRTDDGGHMELQALRYAAMISEMTFEQLVDTFARYKNRAQPDIEVARSTIMEFLVWDDIYEEQFAQDTRIVLAAADFSKELTTAVMWLSEYGVDIRCVRLKPYRMVDGTVLLDVQELIPLPEAAAFRTRIGVKKQAERQNRSERHELRRQFWKALLDRAKTRTKLFANVSPTDDSWIATGAGRSGLAFQYRVTQHTGTAEFVIDRGKDADAENKVVFDKLKAHQSDIENAFGGSLEWYQREGVRVCRIRYEMPLGGYRDDEAMWQDIQDAMIDSMIRLEKALRPFLGSDLAGIVP